MTFTDDGSVGNSDIQISKPEDAVLPIAPELDSAGLPDNKEIANKEFDSAKFISEIEKAEDDLISYAKNLIEVGSENFYQEIWQYYLRTKEEILSKAGPFYDEIEKISKEDNTTLEHDLKSMSPSFSEGRQSTEEEESVVTAELQQYFDFPISNMDVRRANIANMVMSIVSIAGRVDPYLAVDLAMHRKKIESIFPENEKAVADLILKQYEANPGSFLPKFDSIESVVKFVGEIDPKIGSAILADVENNIGWQLLYDEKNLKDFLELIEKTEPDETKRNARFTKYLKMGLDYTNKNSGLIGLSGIAIHFSESQLDLAADFAIKTASGYELALIRNLIEKHERLGGVIRDKIIHRIKDDFTSNPDFVNSSGFRLYKRDVLDALPLEDYHIFEELLVPSYEAIMSQLRSSDLLRNVLLSLKNRDLAEKVLSEYLAMQPDSNHVLEALNDLITNSKDDQMILSLCEPRRREVESLLEAQRKEAEAKELRREFSPHLNYRTGNEERDAYLADIESKGLLKFCVILSRYIELEWLDMSVLAQVIEMSKDPMVYDFVMGDLNIFSVNYGGRDPEIIRAWAHDQKIVSDMKDLKASWRSSFVKIIDVKLSEIDKFRHFSENKAIILDDRLIEIFKDLDISINNIDSLNTFIDTFNKESGNSEFEKMHLDGRKLRDLLIYYLDPEHRPVTEKEKPQHLEFQTLVHEFDTLGQQLALFGSTTWAFTPTLREKIFGPEITDKIEVIKAETKLSPIDPFIYSSYGGSEDESYSLRFHGTKRHDYAGSIARIGQKIGHNCLTGSYSGNLSTAYGFSEGSGSVVCYDREDLRNCYINFGLETDCNAISDNTYTRIPSRIIRNVSGDDKEEVLEKALRFFKTKKALGENAELVTQINEKFEEYLESLGETFATNIEKIYRQMRSLGYIEPKIIEVADFYLRQIVWSESEKLTEAESAQKRVIVFEKILDSVNGEKEGETNIAVIADCLVDNDEARDNSSLAHTSMKKLKGLNVYNTEKLLQKMIRMQQLHEARAALRNPSNSAVERISKEINQFLALSEADSATTRKWQDRLRAKKSLFLGEINGEDLKQINKDTVELKALFGDFHQEVVALIDKKLDAEFHENSIYSKYIDRFDLVLTGSCGRNEATINSDLDCLVIFDDRGLEEAEKNEVTEFFQSEYKAKLHGYVTRLGFTPDIGKAQTESIPSYLSQLENLSVNPSHDSNQREQIEPTNIIDLTSVDGDKKGLVRLFKHTFLRKFSDITEREQLTASIQNDIDKKFMPEWYKGYGQLVSGDRVKNMKNEVLRILDFYLFRQIVKNSGEIAKIEGEDFNIPSSNTDKINLLEKIGKEFPGEGIGSAHAETLRQAVTDLFRWRLRTEIIRTDLDAALLTNKERERILAYVKAINELNDITVRKADVTIS